MSWPRLPRGGALHTVQQSCEVMDPDDCPERVQGLQTKPNPAAARPTRDRSRSPSAHVQQGSLRSVRTVTQPAPAAAATSAAAGCRTTAAEHLPERHLPHASQTAVRSSLRYAEKASHLRHAGQEGPPSDPCTAVSACPAQPDEQLCEFAAILMSLSTL